MVFSKRGLINSIIFICIIFLAYTVFQLPSVSHAAPGQETFWQVQSIDTMKYSRDPSRNPDIYASIPSIVKQVADLHATTIAIGTPYDEEFYPVLKAWVDEARKYHLHVWFRGNFSSWEGWFNYPKMTTIDDHHKMTAAFIANHPELFMDGDIFTPVPEAENGGLGDPRGSQELSDKFNAFLVASYSSCTDAFTQIGKQVTCGYFSMNADIAKQVLTPETVKATGNVVVIDHYVDTPEKMESAILYLHQKFNVPIILGEFGAPIPDINGDMSESEQAQFINSLMHVFYIHKNIVKGINYWVGAGGSTALYNDDGTVRQAGSVIKKYYSPFVIAGTLVDTAGDPVQNAVIVTSDNDQKEVRTNQQGEFTIVSPQNSVILLINTADYEPISQTITFDNTTGNTITQNFVLTPVNPGFWYKIKLFFHNYGKTT